MSGRLTAIDSQAQQIKRELSGESAMVAIADIEKVQFRGKVTLICRSTDALSLKDCIELLML